MKTTSKTKKKKSLFDNNSLNSKLLEIRKSLINNGMQSYDTNLALKVFLYGIFCKNEHNSKYDFNSSEKETNEAVKNLIGDDPKKEEKNIKIKNILEHSPNKNSNISFISYYPVSDKIDFYVILNDDTPTTLKKNINNALLEINTNLRGNQTGSLLGMKMSHHLNGSNSPSNYELIVINLGICHPKEYTGEGMEQKGMNVSIKSEYDIIEKYYDKTFFIRYDKMKYLNNYNNSFMTIPKELKKLYNVDIYNVYIPLNELYNLYNTYGKRLLHKNARETVKKSIVEDEIINGFKNDEKNLKLFFIFNNGLRFASKELIMNDDVIRLENFSVINGGNTLKTLYKACHDKGIVFSDEKHFVRVEIIMTNDEDLITKINKTSNTQNAVESRNLLSNDEHQKHIKGRLYNEQNIDLIIKEGESEKKYLRFSQHKRINNTDLYQLLVSHHFESPVDGKNMKNGIFEPTMNYNPNSRLPKNLFKESDRPNQNQLFENIVDKKTGIVVKNIDLMDELLFIRKLHTDCKNSLELKYLKELLHIMKDNINQKNNLINDLALHLKVSKNKMYSFEEYILDGIIEDTEKSARIVVEKDEEKETVDIQHFIKALYRHLNSLKITNKEIASEIHDFSYHYQQAWSYKGIVGNVGLMAIPMLHRDLRSKYNKNEKFGFEKIYQKYYKYNHSKSSHFIEQFQNAYIKLIFEPLIKMIENEVDFNMDKTSFLKTYNNITYLRNMYNHLLINEKVENGVKYLSNGKPTSNYFEYYLDQFKQFIK